MGEISIPQKGKKLFLDTGNNYECAHFGWGDIDTEFFGYMEGYKTSADDLIEKAVKSQNVKITDTYVFPICFLYRQYLELVMKYIYISFSEKNKGEKESTLNKTNHNLYKIWNEIKLILTDHLTIKDKEDIKIVEDYINQFNMFDKSSLTFRYPITKNLDKVLTDEERLNLVNLKNRMDELYNYFNGCIAYLVEVTTYKVEMLREYF